MAAAERHGGEDGRGLLVLADGGAAGADFGDLADLEGERQRPPGAVGAVAVALEELALGAGLEPSDGKDGDLHRPAPALSPACAAVRARTVLPRREGRAAGASMPR